MVQAEESRFQALHAAMMSGGVVIYVPDNVTVERPFQIVHWLDSGGVMGFPHVLVVTGRNASVTVLDEYLSHDLETPSFVGGAIELVVGENASLTYLDVQNWGDGVYHLSTQRARLHANAMLNWSTGEFGSTLTRFETGVLLEGDGATAFLQGIYFPQKEQHIANHTLQHHRSTHTSSDLLYKGALIGQAHTVYRGLIRVDRGAQQTDAYQANRNLILSPKAHADSIPMLEIEANDVRCTHGATISQIDEEELFYLMSRGIPREQATRVIVDGFFAPVLDRIPLRQVRDRLRTVIHERLGY
ncbi:MAG: Fe-S cluster assembly protein SufD [Ardenticatenia bacterium]|nr:Fe-S cluster assembly protein SufD [Ardenticatenia bacterium]